MLSSYGEKLEFTQRIYRTTHRMITMKTLTLFTGVLTLVCCVNTLCTKVLSDPAVATPAAESTFMPIGKCHLLLPKVIYAAPGQEANIYLM